MQTTVIYNEDGSKKSTVLSAHGLCRHVPAPGQTYKRYTGDYISLDRGAPITIEAVNVVLTAAMECYKRELTGCKITKIEAIHKTAFDLQQHDALFYGMCDQYERDTLGCKITVEVVQTEAGERQMIDEFRRESSRNW